MKKAFLLIGLLFLASLGIAETISQVSLQNMGLQGFSNQLAQARVCNDFVLTKDLNKNSAEFYTVFSLHVDFEPVVSEDANVSVFLNANPQALSAAKATDFFNGWWRVRLPNQSLSEQNTVKVCLQNSLSTTSAHLLDDSLFGTYKLAEFTPTDFTKTLSNQNPLWNEEFTVTVSLHNSGSESADVNILYQKPGVSFKHLAFVKGDTSFAGTIAPQQTVTFSYAMKSTKVGPFTMPGAVAYYANEFGEPQRILSNYPLMAVKEPEIKIKAVVLNKSTEKKLRVGEPVLLQAVITNYGQFEITNIALIFPSVDGLVWNTPSNQTIASIKPNETKTIDFSVTPLAERSFQAGCTLAYLDFDVQSTACEPAQFSVEKSGFPVEWAGGIVLIILAIGVYLYYHYR